jgi:hypothetical protein
MNRVIVNLQVVNTTALCLHNETAGEEYERNSQNLLVEHDLLWRFKLRGWSFEARRIRARGGLKGVNPTNKYTTAYAPEADVKVWILF